MCLLFRLQLTDTGLHPQNPVSGSSTFLCIQRAVPEWALRHAGPRLQAFFSMAFSSPRLYQCGGTILASAYRDRSSLSILTGEKPLTRATLPTAGKH